MPWDGLRVLDKSQKCTDKNIPSVTYKVDVCRIKRVGESGTCFGCQNPLKPAETVYKVHKQIQIPLKDNICLCQPCFTAGYVAVV